MDMLLRIALEVYKDFITLDKRGNKKLLVKCLNALYGTMVAAPLYYQKFTNTLKEEGFKMNPWNPCIWNKIIEGKQCMICFHVDNCKILHASQLTVNQVIEWFQKDYKSVFEDRSRKMKINCGKVHKHLGMTLNF